MSTETLFLHGPLTSIYDHAMGIEYASEKFSSAIYAIVTSDQPETVQDRVYTAMMTTSILGSDDMPPALWSRFNKLHSRMTKVEDEKRGSFRATAETLSDREAHDWIVEFYNLSSEIEDAYHEAFKS